MFKMDVFWNAWSPQIANKVISDVLRIQRLAKVNRAAFVVACDLNIHAYLKALGVSVTEDFSGPQMTMVYIDRGEEVPEDVLARIPDDVEYKVVSLCNPMLPEPTLPVKEIDPYSGIHIPEQWKRINETMPLDKPAPKHDGSEPQYSPWL